MWQDIAITIILLIFMVSLIPTTINCLKKKNKVSMKTAIPTTIGNYGLAIIWLTFSEPLLTSFCTSLVMGTLWLWKLEIK